MDYVTEIAQEWNTLIGVELLTSAAAKLINFFENSPSYELKN